MKKLLYTLAILFVFTACDSSKKESEKVDKEHRSSPHADETKFDGFKGTLDLSPFSITMNDEEVLSLGVDGEITSEGENIGKISPQGIVYDEESEVRVKMNNQGWLVDEGLNPLVKVEDDGSMVNDNDDKLTWQNGEFMRNGKPTRMKISPAGVTSRRAASILIYLSSAVEISDDMEDIEMDEDSL